MSICQSILGDNKNSIISFERIKDVSYCPIDEDLDPMSIIPPHFMKLLAFYVLYGTGYITEELTRAEKELWDFIERYKNINGYEIQIEAAKRDLSGITYSKRLLVQLKKRRYA